ncbi:MAG TPA: hypothetical protein HPP83_06375, partial [Candidatus Hydrogenedentes bacterium]|nr:hypothetical protein [Candidatus Hydrogenedentota bacterium]
MRIYITLALIIAASIDLCSCVGLGPGGRIDVEVVKAPNPWTHLDLHNDPDNFQFAVVADRTGGNRPGVFPDAVAKLNMLEPEFVMCVGDLISGYTKDERILNRQWLEFDYEVEQLGMPFFYVPGNHDISNRIQEKKWEERLGRKYYHFVYRNVLFLCLDTEDPPRVQEPDENNKTGPQLSDAQLAYVARAIADNPNARWTFVFMHRPMWINKINPKIL